MEQKNKRRLGPTHRILDSDRYYFIKILEDLTSKSVADLLTDLRPLEWRNTLVRMVCSSKGLTGEELRKLWVKIYLGDGMYDVRDERRRAKKNNWPLKRNSPRRQDLNSWIGKF